MPAPTTAKEDVMAMLRRLPDDVSIQRIEYHVSVMAGIQEAIEDIEAGRTVTQAEVERLMEEWEDDE
jgi:predicted transcriptional regulator